MSSRPRLLVATANQGKVHEIRELLGDTADLVTLASLPSPPAMPPEDGDTYRANSRIKATVVARATGRPTLADDSGLEVFRLDGRPGVHSSRYGTGDADRIARLLSELGPHVPAPARFVCVASVALPDGRCRSFRGECAGAIIGRPRGSSGFGFDPVFLVDGGDRTMAELTTAQKNRVSHRARAMLAVARFLRSRRGRAWWQA